MDDQAEKTEIGGESKVTAVGWQIHYAECLIEVTIEPPSEPEPSQGE